MRYISLFALAYLVAVCVPAVASTPEDFNKAVQSKGSQYTEARDKLLQPDADVNFIINKTKSDSPQERLTARIILGWRDHKDTYEKLLAEGFIDQKGEKRFAWSYDPDAIKSDYLPLMYELLLKDIGSQGARDAAVRVINYLARQGTDPDVRALVDLLKQEETPEPTRAAVARTVSSLPPTLVKADELASLLEGESTRAGKSKDVAGNLMNGLIRLGGNLPEENRNALVDRVLGMQKLPDLVGETPVVYTIGGIGGSSATTRVSKFLDQTQSPSQKRWALSTLGAMGNDQAANTLLSYAQNADVNQQLRVSAIESLSKSKYTDRIGNALEDIINNGGKSIRERHEAIKSLDRLYQFNYRDNSAEPDIRTRIQRLDPNGVDSSELKSSIKGAKDAVERRLPRQ